MKTIKKRWPLLLIAAILIVGAYVYSRFRTQQAAWKNTVTENFKPLGNQDNANQSNPTATSPDTNQPAAPAPADDTVPLLKTVKYNSANIQQAQAVNLINSFEQAYNQRQADAIKKLFLPTVSVADIDGFLAKDKPVPVSFKFESVDVRADSSALVTVTETRHQSGVADSTHRRIFELVPENDVFQISSYFTPTKTDPLSGFTNE